MTSSRSSQLDFQNGLLQSLEARANVLRVARKDAHDAVTLAQFNLVNLESDLDAVERQLSSVRANVDELKARLDPRVMSSLPIEILRMVFLCLAADAESSWSWDPVHEWDASRVDPRIPYRVASVCARWRQEALHTPALWSFVVVSPPLAPPLCIHLKTMLSRSGTQPIDIAFDFAKSSGKWSPCFAQIMSVISSATRRWRRVVLLMPPGTMQHDVMDAIRRPTPMLEEFVIEWETAIDYAHANGFTAARYLPHCPRLRKFKLTGDFVCPQVYSHLTSLVSIDFLVDEMAAQVLWDILRNSPMLEHLTIAIVQQRLDIPSTPSDRLVLPSLRSLSCQMYGAFIFNAWAANLEVPKLQSLSLEFPNLVHVRNIASRVRDTTTTFHLIHPEHLVVSEHAAVYSVLHNVTSIHVTASGIAPAFFQAAMEQDAWPKLENLIITGVNTWVQGTAEALANFARYRAVSNKSDSSRKLKRIDIDKDCHPPDWLVEQIDFYLSSP